MKILVNCPVPAEFNACREVLALRDIPRLAGCRAARREVSGQEVLAVESGPGKARAASAASAAIPAMGCDMVLDSGSCAGVAPGAVIGEIILAGDCFEYDISGYGIPSRSIAEMHLPSAFAFLSPGDRDALQRRAVEEAGAAGERLRLDRQLCGEYVVQSLERREHLYGLFQAGGANWETAGVYVAGLRHSLPVLSMRVVTDLGNERALADFRRNVRPAARRLYRAVEALLVTGWFSHFAERWQAGPAGRSERLPASVRP